jgi:hypothetical protein
MLIFSYVIKHIIINKNKILHKLFYILFAMKKYLYLLNLYISFGKIYDKFKIYLL